mgnify:CR=1 FL=1
MRVLFIGKRFYTNRDAYKERFGRIYQLPFWWAKAGHEVDFWLIDYHGRDVGTTKDGALTVETTPVLRWRFFVARLACSLFHSLVKASVNSRTSSGVTKELFRPSRTRRSRLCLVTVRLLLHAPWFARDAQA